MGQLGADLNINDQFKDFSPGERTDIANLYPDLKIAQRDFPMEQQRNMSADYDNFRKQFKLELPEIGVARCPWCQAPLKVRIDTYGIGSPYWNPLNGGGPVTRSCEHHVSMHGSLHYHGQVPSAKETGWFNEIKFGPEVPYVVPNLLD